VIAVIAVAGALVGAMLVGVTSPLQLKRPHTSTAPEIETIERVMRARSPQFRGRSQGAGEPVPVSM